MFLLVIGDVDQVIAADLVWSAGGGTVFIVFAEQRGSKPEQGAVLRTPLRGDIYLRSDAEKIVGGNGGFHRIQ